MNRSKHLFFAFAFMFSVNCKTKLNKSQVQKYGPVNPNKEGLTIPKEAMSLSIVELCFPRGVLEACSTGVVLEDGYILTAAHSVTRKGGAFLEGSEKVLRHDNPIPTDGVAIPSTRSNLMTPGYVHPPHFNVNLVAGPSEKEGSWDGYEEYCGKDHLVDVALLRVNPKQLTEFKKWTYPIRTRVFAWEERDESGYDRILEMYTAGFSSKPATEKEIESIERFEGSFDEFDTHRLNFSSGFHKFQRKSSRTWEWKCFSSFSSDSKSGDVPIVARGFSGAPVFDKDGYLLSIVISTNRNYLTDKDKRGPHEFLTIGLNTSLAKEALMYLESSIFLKEEEESTKFSEAVQDHYHKVHKPVVLDYYPKSLVEENERLKYFTDRAKEFTIKFKGIHPIYCVSRFNLDEKTGLSTHTAIDAVKIKINENGGGNVSYRVHHKFNRWDWSEEVAFEPHELLFQYSMYRSRKAFWDDSQSEIVKRDMVASVLTQLYSYETTKERKWAIYGCKRYQPF